MNQIKISRLHMNYENTDYKRIAEIQITNDMQKYRLQTDYKRLQTMDYKRFAKNTLIMYMHML